MTNVTLPFYTYQRVLPFAISTSLAIAFCFVAYQKITTPTEQMYYAPPPISYDHFKPLYDKHFQTTKIITGVIDYSFITSIMNSGLSKREIESLLAMIDNQFDIIGSVQNGDKFSIKYAANSNNEKYISSFYYSGSKTDFFALQDDKYNIYNEHGYQLNGAPFYASPLDKKFRISSSYNLQRMHPVTKKITPHFGTDYAVPIGTELLSIADGVVVKSQYNRFAGNYINIRHTNGSLSRYLHLSQRNVEAGDKVSKGQLIGLTGNTGRTTGPHLHLELFVGGVPVNYENYIQESRTRVNQEMQLAAQIERAELAQELIKLSSSEQGG
jgi:murein DD-endopeptidase